ncbi:glycine cleavage system aminomethyltransferase GcvT [Blastochloris viridis]|uniref:aminomethyltransferase n=1 Tax=Blastochloris viridis TaxID=1079 RepID=A0A0H5BET2_BLAVI|nr:glycine cleavage system aminomethyltransferase GcvT [Blastochloris viridis]ALK10454.1 Aminomethyltransferase [Blastochloris viridis]BAR99604.1 aminomethyltransferase (glycine cleavage system T protein) [Blastochloris viridis]CUU43116.1 Aminomethyltransferase [Blastochloris viridis]
MTELTPPAEPAVELKRTPLHGRHLARGARMVPFAGYEMPVHYAAGILAEHTHTRAKAGLFDISHMGQAFLLGPDHDTVARALEALVPADIVGLAPGRQRYTQLLGEDGGILDDLMVTRSADPAEDGALMLVVNAATKHADFAHIEQRLPAGVRLMRADHRALLALQGPAAAEVLARVLPDVAGITFMTAVTLRFGRGEVQVTRSGYTGEDGFELSVRADRVAELWDTLERDGDVLPVGLGARDSLRLEAGLCLYGHDIDPATSPVEAGLAWSIQPRRRVEGGFPGAERIQRELAEGPARLRVGLLPEGKALARDATEIVDLEDRPIGQVTSGGFGPTVGGPIAMGYVGRRFAEPDTPVRLMVRGKPLTARVVPLPFVPHRYVRGS